MSNFFISTKNQFKETTRYLQKKLSEELNTPIKLSTIQEAVSKSMGYSSFQHYINVLKIMQTEPPKAEYANGDMSIEIQSLNFCMNAAKGCSGTQSRIKAILLHLYNNIHPVKIDLKNFDQTHRIHILNVIALDARPYKEIHNYIDNGNEIFHAWAEEAHENREYAKHKDNIYSFCESIEKIQNFSYEPILQDKNLEQQILREWKYYMDGLECSIAPVNITTDGLYAIMVLAKDEHDYKYSVCIRFNLIDEHIYVCEESEVNEECTSGLIHSTINQEYQRERQEYGDEPYLAYRGYFTDLKKE